MGKNTENAIGTPTIILMGAGAVISALLFYFMFKFADDGNLLMVVITASLIAIISFGVVKGLTVISRNKYIK
jgi:ABC-type Fe3+-siderophore transport system permease subunit